MMITRIITTSVHLVIFCFCCLSFQNQFTFNQRQFNKCVFVQQKTRNQLKRSRPNIIVNMNSDIPYLHEFSDEVFPLWQVPFHLEINCTFTETLKVEEKNTDVNERTIGLDCVEIWLILKSRLLTV